jgi:hypothetical protein
MSTVQYNNLSGVIVNKEDGNLAPEAAKTAPRVAIIGTAGQGRADSPFLIQTTAIAKVEFGTDGNLLRGMWEAKAAGATDLYLYRIGAEPAIVTGVGGNPATLNDASTTGFIIETVVKDESAGDDYSLYYVASTNNLVIKRNFDDLVVYDNNPAAPINRYEVIVSGYKDPAAVDIGNVSTWVTFSDLDGTVTYSYANCTAGSDGLSLSRMKMYEKLEAAYEHLKEYGFDVVVPMDVYLDDYNTVNQGHYKGAVAPEATGNTYPTAGAYLPNAGAGDVDALGMVYMEEYEGKKYFWWRFSNDPNVSTADIWPASIGSASATQKIDGTVLTGADFHEVNFAYQLASFLHSYSTNIVDATGVIGVLPPASESIADRARWLGKSPAWSFNTSTGAYYINVDLDNGNGLLGNKFMVGQAGYRSGVFGGGFILTTGDYLDDGEEVLDTNDIPVDLGKYISVVVDYPLLKNSFNSLGYIASFAASYAGFYVNMSPASAPTNKKVANAQIVYRQNLTNLDALAGNGYVVLRNKPQGLVIADAPTATMPESDWRRLSTVRIVKSVVDGVRNAVDPFLGESLSAGKKGALQVAIENVLLAAKKTGVLADYRPFEIIQTPQMAVAGRAEIALVLVPAFELRQIVITVSVSKS